DRRAITRGEQRHLLGAAAQEDLAGVVVRDLHAEQVDVEALRALQVLHVEHDVVDPGHLESGLQHDGTSLLVSGRVVAMATTPPTTVHPSRTPGAAASRRASGAARGSRSTRWSPGCSGPG